MTPPSITKEEIDRLSALAEGTRARSPVHATELASAFDSWARDIGLAPGVAESVTSSDACRHFQAWAAERGITLPEVKQRSWAEKMRRFGFAKLRTYRGRRFADLLLLKARPAYILKQWLKENPPPPVGANPFRRKGT